MRKFLIKNIEKECFFYEVKELPWFLIEIILTNAKSFKTKTTSYNEEFCTFDIEATSFEFNDNTYGFMYIWQMNLFGSFNVYGRTWDEWVKLLNELLKILPEYQTLVIYVHYLPYEFQFFRDYIYINEVFLTDKRKPLKLVALNRLEFRCSYKLSNMSLEKFIENTPNAIYRKQSGEDFNYDIIRTAETELTDEEMGYCFCDVAGLHEAISSIMKAYNDNIKTIPLTSTGYVRREARKAFQSNPKNTVRYLELDANIYRLLKTARRGGNSHCNPIYSDELLKNMRSRDMSSAYPAVMIHCKFPMSAFWEQLPYIKNNKLSFENGWAYIFEIEFKNLRLKNICTIPYIPTAKATSYSKIKPDNGRVLSAELFSMCMTDIDYEIIEKQYDWDSCSIIESYAAKYDYLWDEYRLFIKDSYIKKCDLKDKKYLYNKEKNKINALYGMMLTDIVHLEQLYVPNSENPYVTEMPDIDYGIKKYYNNPNSFVHYAHGVWVTAHCRRRLQQAIDLLGEQIVYCDTDSVKYMDFEHEKNEEIFRSINEQIDLETKQCGIETKYTNKFGSFTLGHWEEDGDYKQFKSLGAKKYCYIDENDKFSITVAGLSKDKGRKYLERNGGIKLFKNGTIIPAGESGRTASVFNDIVNPFYIDVNGYKQEIRSNIGIKNVSYTFGLSQDYQDLIDEIREIYK